MLANKLSKSTRQTIFIILLCLVPFLTPATALFTGLLVAFTLGNPFIEHNQVFTKILLQVSVVGLGFGMNISEALQAGKTGFWFTLVSITLTMTLGLLFARLLKVKRETGMLISGGTAICGGSAIAALAPVVRANDQDMTVSLGTIFTLNAAALFIFPVVGRWLGMDDVEFGYWCAIAIHDTSSVVGAAASYSETALQIATTTKLIRALWIIPLSLVVALAPLLSPLRGKMAAHQPNGVSPQGGTEGGLQVLRGLSIPWFIFLYVLAMIIATYLPQGEAFYAEAVKIAKMGMIYTLFLIGSGLSWDSLKQVGFRPILLGIILWIIISVLSATVILWIGF